MNHLIDLTVDECVELLSTGLVGRVAFQSPSGIQLIPVNYAMDGDAIVWRTSPYSQLGTHAPGHEVAFEVDDLDFEEKRAWSVVARGVAQIVDDPDEVAEIRRVEDPLPWAAGQRHLYIRLQWNTIDGRRIGEAPTDSKLSPSEQPLGPSSYR